MGGFWGALAEGKGISGAAFEALGERHALKQKHAEEARKNQLDEFDQNIQSLSKKMEAVKDSDPKQYAEYEKQLEGIRTAKDAFLNPARGPGLAGWVGHGIKELKDLGRKQAAAPMTAEGIAARAGAPASAGAPATLSEPFKLGAVEPGTAAMVLPGAGPGPTFPAQPAYKVKGPMPELPVAHTKAKAKKEVAAHPQPSVTVQPTAQQAGAVEPITLAAEPAYRPVAAVPSGVSAPEPPKVKHPWSQREIMDALAARKRVQEEMRMGEEALPTAAPNEIKEYRRKLIEGGFSPEEADKETRRKYLPETKEPTEKYFPQLQTTTDETGKEHYWRVPMSPGDSPEEVNFQGQTLTAKTGTSQFNETLAAYAKEHNIPWSKIPQAAFDYVGRKLAMDRAIPSSTTTTSLKQDAQGQWVPITETNYRTPGGGVKLVDPIEKPISGAAAVPSVPSATKTTPSTGEAKKAPKSTIKSPSSAGAARGAGPGNVRVGAALFQGRSPEATVANKNVDIAQNSLLDVQKAAQNPTPVGDQGVVLAWLRGRVNRVTATEIAAVNNLGGAQLKFEGNLTRIVSGKMTDEQRNWFLQSAQNNYDNAITVASKYSGGSSAPPAGGGGTSTKSLADRLNNALEGK